MTIWWVILMALGLWAAIVGPWQLVRVCWYLLRHWHP
jgi:hypothetical protein